jgi:hypothetical protein
MRTVILLLLWATCSGAFAGQSSTNLSDRWVVICSVRGAQPTVVVRSGDFLLAEHEFRGEIAERWQTNYALFSKALVEAAHKDGLDASSLDKILQNLRTAPENKRLAILPYAAHWTKSNGEEVWEVALRWESESGVAHGASLAHARVFTFTRNTLKLIGFWTCG